MPNVTIVSLTTSTHLLLWRISTGGRSPVYKNPLSQSIVHHIASAFDAFNQLTIFLHHPIAVHGNHHRASLYFFPSSPRLGYR